MTTKTAGLWTRFVDSLRIKPLKPFRRSDIPEVDEEGLLSQPAQHPADEGPSGEMDGAPGADGHGGGKSPSPLSRWSKRDQTLARLQDGYDRMLHLMEDIQDHMATQGERGERICHSLEQLAKAMSDHPTTSRQQSEMLKTIAAQIETANTRNQHLVEAVSRMPELSQSQNESLNKLNRQLETANEQSASTHRAMDQVGGTLRSLGEAHGSQAAALREMNEKTNQQNELMIGLIAAQSKRFTMLFVVTLILAVAAVGATLLGVLATR